MLGHVLLYIVCMFHSVGYIGPYLILFWSGLRLTNCSSNLLKVYNLLGHGLLCIVCLFTGTVVSANIFSVTHDPHLFGEDVEAFRPERFLSEDEVYTKPQKFIVFGMGKWITVNPCCESYKCSKSVMAMWNLSIVH